MSALVYLELPRLRINFLLVITAKHMLLSPFNSFLYNTSIDID